jgi:hypothetical protein
VIERDYTVSSGVFNFLYALGPGEKYFSHPEESLPSAFLSIKLKYYNKIIWFSCKQNLERQNCMEAFSLLKENRAKD